MESKINFTNWLSKKLYLSNVGFYATIGVVMTMPAAFIKHFEIKPFWASVFAFFIVAFFRAAYESVIIYEAPIKSLQPDKMVKLSFITALIMTLVASYLKPKMGNFSIPISLIISMIVVKRLKEKLWGPHKGTGLLAQLPAKLNLNRIGLYGFYIFLVGISYTSVTIFGFHSFPFAFAAGYFVGMIFEESFNCIKLYEQKLNTKSVIAMIAWAAFCGIASTAIVMVILNAFGDSAGQAATVTGVMVLKLIQPLGTHKFILGL